MKFLYLMRLCSLCVLTSYLFVSIAHAAFPSGTQGVNDISALRTHWFYRPAEAGWGCYSSEQSVIDAVVDSVMAWSSTCDITNVSTSSWPSDPEEGKKFASTECTDTAEQEYGPLPDVTDQTAVPHYGQSTYVSWTRKYTRSSSCPIVDGVGSGGTTLSRQSYEYCPTGYLFHFSSVAGAADFVAPAVV